jgi:hypothetical protein
MAVRRIRVDEARTLRELTRALTLGLARRFPEDRIGISEEGLDNLETYYRLGARHQDVLVLVAEDDGEIAGFVDAVVSRSGGLPGVAGEVGDLWVRPDAPAVTAEALVAGAVRELRARGAGPIFHLDDATRPAREPWESLGFELDVVRFSLYAE